MDVLGRFDGEVMFESVERLSLAPRSRGKYHSRMSGCMFIGIVVGCWKGLYICIEHFK